MFLANIAIALIMAARTGYLPHPGDKIGIG